jgi:hypothetical protein
MIVFLTIIGALFCISGTIFGLMSVLWGSKFQYYLLEKHNDIFHKLTGANENAGEKKHVAIDSRSLWKYVKSEEDNGMADVFMYKNRIKMYFIIFSILFLVGTASLGAAIVMIVFS